MVMTNEAAESLGSAEAPPCRLPAQAGGDLPLTSSAADSGNGRVLLSGNPCASAAAITDTSVTVGKSTYAVLSGERRLRSALPAGGRRSLGWDGRQLESRL
jgi:hypothetical protein